MKQLALSIGVLIGMAAKACAGASSLIAVYQVGEYPGSGEPATPSGLVFEVCSDGSFFRSPFGKAAASAMPEQGTLSDQTLQRLEADLEKKWLSPIRAECAQQGVTLHAAMLRIEAGLGGNEFYCSLYKLGKSLEHFEAMVAGLSEQTSRPTSPRVASSCK